MVWLRWFTLVIAAVGSACTGSPTESATGSADDDDDDGDDDDDDDGGDTTNGSGAEATVTDPSDDPTGDPATDPSVDTTAAEDSNGDSDPTTEGGSDPTTGGEEGTAGETGDGECYPVLSEIAFNLVGGDDELEWIAIHNPCNAPLDLADYSVGWGGEDYTYGTAQLDGMIMGKGCFVVGGPDVSETNYSPAYDQMFDFELDLQNSENGDADGIGIFLGPPAGITAASIPVSAVVYGETNTFDLVDEHGEATLPDVAAGTDSQTIARTPAGNWLLNDAPTPNDCAEPAD